MPIGVQTPITSHTGNGTATVFAYDFAILSADDIKVKVGGSIVTTGFTVAGIGDRDGGTVTFSAAPGSGVEVLLYREVSRERSTDYQYAGDLREDVLDDDLDRIVMALQEDAELIARGIRVPVGESLAELPDAASRENKVLTFGDGGAIALLDLADLLGGGGSITIIPADGSVTLVKLDASTQALINGALQRSGGTMTGKITLDGDAANALHAVPKQQVDSLIATSVSNRMQHSLTAAQATTSGTALDFTSIPSWAKRITLVLSGFSTSGTARPYVQIGSGAFETSGYVGAYYDGSGTAFSSAFVVGGALAANVIDATMVLVHMGSNKWQLSASGNFLATGVPFNANGSKTTVGVLDRLRLTTSNGTDTFDAGSVSLLIEG